MTDDFTRYEAMRDAGEDPKAVYHVAKSDGHDEIASIRMLRSVFSLSLAEAKEVTLIGDGLADNLSQYQERFVAPLREALKVQE